MLSTNPEEIATRCPATDPRPNLRRRWWLRIALFVLHTTILLVAAFLFIPAQHDFEFGYSFGVLLFCSTILLWFLLFLAQTRRGMFVFCALVLGQAGLVALIGLHFQAEDRRWESFAEELTAKRAEWAKKMEPYRMDALFDMISGKRPLSLTELQELQNRARDGRVKLSELKSDMERLAADEERQLKAVDSGSARDFRRGVESSRNVSDEQMKLIKDIFTESEQLAAFLIDRHGEYAQTSEGLRFKKDEDAQYFANQRNTIVSAQKRLAAINHRVEQECERLQQPVPCR